MLFVLKIFRSGLLTEIKFHFIFSQFYRVELLAAKKRTGPWRNFNLLFSINEVNTWMLK